MLRTAPQWGQPPIPWWLPCKEAVPTKLSHPEFPLSCAWNAKCLIFLGNFTPKTSNYCLKNRALGFPGGAFFWLRIMGWYAGSSRWRNLLSCAKWSHHVQLFKKRPKTKSFGPSARGTSFMKVNVSVELDKLRILFKNRTDKSEKVISEVTSNIWPISFP